MTLTPVGDRDLGVSFDFLDMSTVDRRGVIVRLLSKIEGE